MITNTNKNKNATLVQLFGEALSDSYPDLQEPKPTKPRGMSTRLLDQEDYEDDKTTKDHKDHEILIQKESTYSDLVRKVERLSINEYVRDAYEHSRHNDWQTTNQSPTWQFCRLLKARSDFADLGAGDLLAEIENYVNLTELEKIAVYDEWPKVKIPAGTGVLECAFQLAKAEPMGNLPGPKTPTYQLLMSLASHLQKLRRDQPIMLPVVPLSELLGTTARTISRCRQIGIREHVLKEVEPYRFKKAATKFRFCWDNHSDQRGPFDA